MFDKKIIFNEEARNPAEKTAACNDVVMKNALPITPGEVLDFTAKAIEQTQGAGGWAAARAAVKAVRPIRQALVDATGTSMAAEASTASADTEPGNSQPNGAYNINVDVLYKDTVGGKGKRRWYFFQLAEKKKITAYMSPVADAAVDNDLELYKLDTATNQLTRVAQSQNPAGMYELLSFVSEPGYYFLCVAAYAGETANEFSFMAHLSDKWDEKEGDDSLLQAQEQPIGAAVKHTLDNAIDHDMSVLPIREAGFYTIRLADVPENCNYQLQIMNAQMQILDVLDKNTVKAKNLPVAAYVLRLLSTDGSFDSDAEVVVQVDKTPTASLGAIAKHTLEEASGDKLLGLTIAEAGFHEIAAKVLQEGKGCKVQLLGQDMQVLAEPNAAHPASPLLVNLAAGNYLLRLTAVGNAPANPAAATFAAADMTRGDAAEGSKLLAAATAGAPAAPMEAALFAWALPSSITSLGSSARYFAWTRDGSHFVEYFAREDMSERFVRVDGRELKYQRLDCETTRMNTSNNSSDCSISTSVGTKLLQMAIGDFGGSMDKRMLAVPRGHLLIMTVKGFSYGEHHFVKSYNLSDVSSAQSIMSGTDRYGMTYYSGFWSGTRKHFEEEPEKGKTHIIVDLDTLTAVDFTYPNWFHGTDSIAGYREYAFPEYPRFVEPLINFSS